MAYDNGILVFISAADLFAELNNLPVEKQHTVRSLDIATKAFIDKSNYLGRNLVP